MHNGEVMRKLIPATERGTMGRTFLTGDAAFKALERAGFGGKHHWSVLKSICSRGHTHMYEIASDDTIIWICENLSISPSPYFMSNTLFSHCSIPNVIALHQHLELFFSVPWKVTVWDIETGAQKKVFNCHSHVLVLAVSPFLGLIAAGEVQIFWVGKVAGLAAVLRLNLLLRRHTKCFTPRFGRLAHGETPLAKKGQWSCDALGCRSGETLAAIHASEKRCQSLSANLSPKSGTCPSLVLTIVEVYTGWILACVRFCPHHPPSVTPKLLGLLFDNDMI